MPRACAEPEADADLVEIPLFDPLSDEVEFPFPQPDDASASRYAFDRPAHVRLLRDAHDAANGEEAAFGHCVAAGDGAAADSLMLGADTRVRVGTVGVALKLVDVDFASGAGSGPSFFEEAGETAVASVTAAYRFVVEEVTRTFPYPAANVRRLRDAPLEADESAIVLALELEAEVRGALLQLINRAGVLSSDGAAGEAPGAAALAFLAGHDVRVAQKTYASLTERLESFSFGVCGLVALPYDEAADALSTTNPLQRLETLRSFLLPFALDDAGNPSTVLRSAGGASGAATGVAAGAEARPSMLGGTTAFTPIDIPLGKQEPPAFTPDELPEGTRLEYWWDEELGWLKATVKRQLRLGGELLHTLEFDMDGAVENLSLHFSGGEKRWRPESR